MNRLKAIPDHFIVLGAALIFLGAYLWRPDKTLETLLTMLVGALIALVTRKIQHTETGDVVETKVEAVPNLQRST